MTTHEALAGNAEDAMPELFELVADAVDRIAPGHLSTAARAHTCVEDWRSAATGVAAEVVAGYRMGELAPTGTGNFDGLTSLGYADDTTPVVERPPFGWTNGTDWWHPSQVDVAVGVGEPECWLDAVARTVCVAVDEDEVAGNLAEAIAELLGDELGGDRAARHLAEVILEDFALVERVSADEYVAQGENWRDEPEDCPACVAVADTCPYHLGRAAGESLAISERSGS